jgi:DNA-binding transcriptional MerR regulator
MLKIGDFSRLSQVPIKTLRYYDEVGLLSPLHVDAATGYRYYGVDQVSRLNRILVFKDLGFSLAEITDLMKRDVPVDQIRDLLRVKQTALEQRVQEERARLARLEARIAQLDCDGNQARYDIVLKRIEPRLVASLRDTVRSYSGANELFGEVERYLALHNATGDRGAVWHACLRSGRAIDCEALVFLRNPVPSSSRIAVYELPATTMACVIHRGPDVETENAYRAARSWMAASGYSAVGPNRELYLYENPSTGESVLEIQVPVEKAARDVDDRVA